MKNDNNEIPESIFSDLKEVSEYAGNVKNARYWLFMLSAYWLVFGVINYLKITNDSNFVVLKQWALYRLIQYLAFGVVYLVLALYSFKKASLSFLIAMLFYTAHSIWLIIINTFDLQRMIINLLVIFILIKGFKDAKQYEKIVIELGDQTAKPL